MRHRLSSTSKSNCNHSRSPQSCPSDFSGLEGYLLWRRLVVVFDTGSHRRVPLYIFGYGVPAVFVIATVIAAFLGYSDGNGGSTYRYHREDVCWLGDDYLLPAFGIPLFVVLIFNIVVLIIGLRINYKVRGIPIRQTLGIVMVS